MSNRTIVITGASDGIGAAAARHFARSGDQVVMVGRSRSKTQRLAEDLHAPYHVTDFADLNQVRDLATALAATYSRIDVLVNNAGAMIDRFALTRDGIETTLQVNHLAPFLLTNLLLDTLASSGARVVTTASDAASLGHLNLDDLQNQRDYTAKKAYGDSKLANILFTRELDRRYRARGVGAVAFHPGNVASSFAADTTSNWRFIYQTPLRHLVLISPERGAKPMIRLADSRPGVDWQPGLFYVKNRPATPNPQATDADLAAALWERSAHLVDLPHTA